MTKNQYCLFKAIIIVTPVDFDPHAGKMVRPRTLDRKTEGDIVCFVTKSRQ